MRYDLPKNWSEEKNFSFEHLTHLVEQVHNSAYSSSVKAINRFATIRNYIIGFYIVEYEQNGSDRAKYGDKLLKRLAEQVNKRGVNETLLQSCRRFYSMYPQIQSYLIDQNIRQRRRNFGKQMVQWCRTNQYLRQCRINLR